MTQRPNDCGQFGVPHSLIDSTAPADTHLAGEDDPGAGAQVAVELTLGDHPGLSVGRTSPGAEGEGGGVEHRLPVAGTGMIGDSFDREGLVVPRVEGELTGGQARQPGAEV
ncbi:hypothetical protein [Streptomyces flaveus]|uniref:hypothetical protein n=1 Tax=Streptomyces flaveus TaxID=66370 RepID=UPI00166F6DA9|nr:hypothetical protein [Streptomyces flaveus]